MYYYEIQDANGSVIKQSTTSYVNGIDAANAAKDDLATMYVPNYPVEIRIYDGPLDDAYRYCSSTYYMAEEDVKRHALEKIEAANRQEFIDILANAQKGSDTLGYQFSQGLLTPLDYAKSQEGLWLKAWFDIENKG